MADGGGDNVNEQRLRGGEGGVRGEVMFYFCR